MKGTNGHHVSQKFYLRIKDGVNNIYGNET